jgi:23S rRNA (uracil1939-C5)-methyltransferase
MNASKLGDVVELRIERIVGGGFGFGRHEGRPIFVSYAAPGDLAVVRVDRLQGSVSFGTVVDVIESGPNRQEAPCPHFGSCGGCDLQHLTYEAQLSAKQEILRDALRRIGGFRDDIEIPVVASPLPWGYRARAEWQRDLATGALGYFKRGSHAIEDVSVCYVLAPPLEHLRVDLRRRTSSLQPREIHAAAGEDGVTTSPSIEDVSDGPVTVKIGGDSLRFDASCFFQTNLGILPAVIDEVMRTSQSDEATSESALDLFCGVGLLTLPLARRYHRVVGVETSRQAVKYARGNARFAGLANASFAAMTAEDWLAHRASEFGPVAQVVVDPPRVGLEAELIARIVRLAPARIAYVSCDPATLARDLKRFSAAGYVFDSVVAFDMFPQNHHLEAVAHLHLQR